MKILHVVFALRYGGLETMLVDLTRHQVESDEVSVLIINDEIDKGLLDTFDPRVRIMRMGRKPGGNPLSLLWHVNRQIRRLHPDIIHCHNAKAPGIIRGLDKRMVFTIHAENVPHRWLRAGIRYIAISDTVSADMLNRQPAFSITTIPNGIETSSITRRDARKPGSPVRLVNLGRLVSSVKGQDILLKALTLLPESYIADFIGTGADEEALRRMAHSLGLENRVRFLGMRSREWIYSHLADYDIMVHPSRLEGFGLAVAEGMAAGLPVAVSNRGGLPEIVRHGQLGKIFEPDPQECAATIRSITEDYPAAQIVATIAYDTVCRKYSMERMAAEYRKVYSSMLNL